MRRKALIPLGICFLLTGCASTLWVKEATDGKPLEGVPFYLSKPYLLRVTYTGHRATPTRDQNTKAVMRDQEGKVVMDFEREKSVLLVTEEILYLPDTNRLYQTNYSSMPFATANFALDYRNDDKSSPAKISMASNPPTIKDVAEAAEKFKKTFGIAAVTAPPPGTTEIRLEILPLNIPKK